MVRNSSQNLAPQQGKTLIRHSAFHLMNLILESTDRSFSVWFISHGKFEDFKVVKEPLTTPSWKQAPPGGKKTLQLLQFLYIFFLIIKESYISELVLKLLLSFSRIICRCMDAWRIGLLQHSSFHVFPLACSAVNSSRYLYIYIYFLPSGLCYRPKCHLCCGPVTLKRPLQTSLRNCFPTTVYTWQLNEERSKLNVAQPRWFN